MKGHCINWNMYPKRMSTPPHRYNFELLSEPNFQVLSKFGILVDQNVPECKLLQDLEPQNNFFYSAL